jgi:hypothetical protein
LDKPVWIRFVLARSDRRSRQRDGVARFVAPMKNVEVEVLPFHQRCLQVAKSWG